MPKGLQETPADGEKGRKGKRGPGKLQRPTICICNDPYVPALHLWHSVTSGQTVGTRRFRASSLASAPGPRGTITAAGT